MTTLDRRLDHMRELVRLNAPAPIMAHYFVHVLFTRMAAEIGIKDVARELAAALANGLAFKSGTCVVCHERPMADRDGVCPKCQADIEQLAAELEAMPIGDGAEPVERPRLADDGGIVSDV